jgi:hypothetical protein
LVLVEDDATPYTGVDDGGTAEKVLLLTTDVQLIQQQALMQLQEKSLLSWGTCTFVKRLHWQQNGAIAVIIINNVAEDGPVNGGGEEYEEITIPQYHYH